MYIISINIYQFNYLQLVASIVDELLQCVFGINAFGLLLIVGNHLDLLLRIVAQIFGIEAMCGNFHGKFDGLNIFLLCLVIALQQKKKI